MSTSPTRPSVSRRPRRNAPVWPLVCLEGVPLLAPYVAAAREHPDDHAAQLDFAAVLFEREIYFTALYGPYSPHGAEPPRAHSTAWQPHPVTDAGRDALRRRRELSAEPRVPLDLFGLKAEALDGLERTLHPTRPQPVATLLAAAFASDLEDHLRAAAFAERVLHDAPSHRMALAWAYSVTMMSAGTAASAVADRSAARALEKRVRRVFGSHWTSGVTRELEKHALAVRRVAWRARTEVEGDGFTRFLKTEGQFCEEARAAAMAPFDTDLVPEALQGLMPVARRFGVGDDSCRAYFLRRASASDRASLRRLVDPHRDAIQAWVSSYSPGSLSATAAAFFWLLEATEGVSTP